MRTAGVRRLLVTGPHGEPAGIVSIDDLVDGLAAELASAARLVKAGTERETATLRTRPRSKLRGCTTVVGALHQA